VWIGVTSAQSETLPPSIPAPLFSLGKPDVNGDMALHRYQTPDFAGVLNGSNPARCGKCAKMLQI